ncbi:MAG: hypothetical protein AAGF12_24045 [Myxococcota bacterium]
MRPEASVPDGAVVVDSSTVDASPFDAGPEGGFPDASVLACGTMDGTCQLGSDDCDADQSCEVSGASTMCMTRMGTKPAGEACELSDECAPGLSCFAEGRGGVCARPCCPTEVAACGATPEFQCRGGGVLQGGEPSAYWHCTQVRPCQVLFPEDACGSREGCYIISDDGETQCLHAGTAETNEGCSTQNDCAPGFFCGGLGRRTCRRICSLDVPSECPPGEGECQAQTYTPDGSGICTENPSNASRSR